MEAGGLPKTKPFAAFLQEQRKGVLHTELGESLQEVARGVLEHEKAGTLTVTFTIAPGPEDGTVKVSDKVTAKVPEADKKPSVFWPDESGNLSRRDPRQPELPLREIAGGAGEQPGEATA